MLAIRYPTSSMRRGITLLCLLALPCLLFACDDKTGGDFAAEAAGHRLKVLATTSILGDWATVVGGDDVDVKTLVGPDGDPHEYEPVPEDNITLANANIVLENGLGLEPWLDKLYESSRSAAKRVVVSQGIDVRHVSESDGARTGDAASHVPTASGGGKASDDAGSQSAIADDRDPHAWQDVADAMIMVGNIRDAFDKADPAHAAGYQSRAADYLKRLAELDNWARAQIASIPAARRKLVTSHDAFAYFGRRYGIDVTRNALESVTTEASDPSAGQLAEVIGQIKASGVPVIFIENIQNPRLIDQIASEAGVRVGPALYSDALGQPGTPGDSYVKMIQYNVQTLVTALSQ